MKKEFELSAKLNTADFDRSVQEMVKKLKDVSQPISAMQQNTNARMQQNGMGGMSPQSMEAFQKATQGARREMDALISQTAKDQEKMGRFIAQRAESIKKMVQEQKSMVQGSTEELKIREKIIAAEKNQQQLKEAYRQRDAQLNQALDAKEQMAAQSAQEIKARNPEGWGRVGRFASNGMYGAAGREAYKTIGGIGGVGSILATVGAVGQAGSEAYRDFSKGAVRTENSMGSAVSGTMGRQVSDIYGRRSAFEQMFAPERARAARQSLETLNANQNADKASMGFGLLKNLGAGIAGGAALGGAVGMFGGPIGAAGGALIGGGLGLGKGIMNIMGDERQRSLALSPFSDTAKKRYGSMLAEDMVNDYSSSYEGQKKQNPFKTAAVGEYEQNWQRNLMAQRSMGLNNEGFYGKNGFLNNNISAGFTPEMGLEMAGNIQSAGGSTRMSRDSVIGNQMSRGLDLTNAGSVLGTLSGSLGSSESTKQATIKILAEGMKLGLDDSKFAEENRRFTQMTAEIVARSGASGEDVGRVSGKFGSFVGENTTLGLSAAKTAYEQYQQISQTTTGPRGVMRAAGFLGDKDLSKLSTMTKQALMQVPEGDLNKDNPLVLAAAQESGMTPDDIVKKVTGVNQGAVSRFKEADTIRDRLKAGMQKLGKERLTEEDIKNLPEDMKKDFNKLTTFQTTELGYQGQRETYARALGTINPAETAEGKQNGRENIINDKMSSVDRTGRMEDTTVKAMAADSKVVLENFNEMAPAMKKAAESTAAWTREVREASAAMQQALEAARANKNADTLKTVEDLMKKMAAPANQQQSGVKK